MKIGSTITYNAFRLGYIPDLTIRSLLLFCDKVVVVDGGSNDGSLEMLKNMSAHDDRIIIKEGFPMSHWTDTAKLQQLALNECEFGDWHCHLDADEVMHEDDFEDLNELFLQDEWDFFTFRWVHFYETLEKLQPILPSTIPRFFRYRRGYHYDSFQDVGNMPMIDTNVPLNGSHKHFPVMTQIRVFHLGWARPLHCQNNKYKIFSKMYGKEDHFVGYDSSYGEKINFNELPDVLQCALKERGGTIWDERYNEKIK